MKQTKILIAAFLAISAIFLAGGAEAGQKVDGFTKHFGDSLFEITGRRLFSVEMRIKGHGLSLGANTLELIIHDSFDRDVAGALLTVVPVMPETGRGLEKNPEVVEKGGGLYSVECQIPTAGHWQIKVTVKKGDTEDSAVFDFPAVASLE
jgi:hypothetical protein